ncbi:proline--tRNA ligase [Actinoplanes sp. NBRC 101535]|uniref:proline--tRNA ligase n=1 Tax=Actinoplanes sp. NBRC 101535 TaxID=3032196 RepID=UPI0024A4E3FE|nr:proline--tRNA ligase [Actinoplanes sp. NBRC 101535]GLY05433.1 proline--tRNA ligase [Actinoplanes sp. NBRC 101535]
MSKAFGSTLHTAPGHSESEGHQLLLRAAMVRQVGAGIFSYLPFGWRTIRKIEAILRAEMEQIGGQEVSLPVVNPADLWKESGRYAKIGPELARFKDRRDRDMVLAMTHEEAATTLARTEIASYRDLPRVVFQLQTKFRDDARPRAGLIRVREFIMKDAYSFAADEDGLAEQYREQFRAYHRIFRRCGVPVRAVLSDVGMMGGSMAHEFMYLTPIGEDTLLLCDGCGFAANREVASFREPVPVAGAIAEIEEVATPGTTTIDQLTALLGVTAAETAKMVFLAAEREDAVEFVAVVVRGDREVNETKVANLVRASALRPMTEAEIQSIGAVAGYGSAIGLRNATVLVDDLVAAAGGLVSGANRAGFHLLNVNAGRDFPGGIVADVTAARAGDGCPSCGQGMRTVRGVEAGNIFKLGTRYSSALNAVFLDAAGERRPLTMGCYGIGVGRLLACAAEENRDEKGLRLPAAIAPYHVSLVLLDSADSAAGVLARRFYDDLWAAGVEVLFDDRVERAGVKFADADLIGLPLRITLGKRGVADGTAEVRDRVTGEISVVALDDVVAVVRDRIAVLLAAPDSPAPVELPDELAA